MLNGNNQLNTYFLTTMMVVHYNLKSTSHNGEE